MFKSLLLFLAVGSMAFPADWPSFLGPDGDGTVRDVELVAGWGKEGPRRLWHKQVGESYAAPSVVGDRVYFFDRNENRARLSCFDLESGKRHWVSEYPTAYEDMYGFGIGPKVPPLIEGDAVYTYGVEGRLCRWRAEDGALVWEVDTVAKYGVIQNFFGVGASPILYKNLLIAQVGGSPADSPDIQRGDPIGNGSGIVAFDKRTGKEVYKLTDELASYAAPRIVTHNGRDWCFILARGGLVGFNPANGKQDFHYPFRSKLKESCNVATPVIVDDTVLLTEGYGKGSALLRFAPGQVSVIRADGPRNQSLASHWATPIYHKGFLYGCHGRSSGNARLRCIEYESGKVVWEKKGLQRTSLILNNEHFLVLDERGILILMEANPKAYKEIGRIELDIKPAWNAPTLASGRVLVLGGNQLICLDLRQITNEQSKGSENQGSGD